MGKTSILSNLNANEQFGRRTLIVDFNMQRLGPVRSTAELLLRLTRRSYDAGAARALDGLAPPDQADFLEVNAYDAFERFLDRLDRTRQGHRFIITVDEFEKLEQRIEAGDLDAELLEHWRATFQNYPCSRWPSPGCTPWTRCAPTTGIRYSAA